MASNTPRLNLYKKDPVADATDTFNIQTMLNDNWDRIDQNVALKQEFDEHLADYVKHPGYGVATGSANTYAVTLNPAPTSYVEGMAVAVKINIDNTGPSTINVNGLGAKAIKKPNGNDVSAGNLKAGSIYTLRYNGTNFILQGEGGEGTAQPQHVLSGQTFTNNNGLQTGTMPNRTFTANGGNYIPALSALGDGGGNLCIEPQTGYYEAGKNANGFGSIIVSDPDFIPANIKQGVNIFGVSGSFDGKRYASGTATVDSNGLVTVNGLTFKPTVITCFYPTNTIYFIVYDGNRDATKYLWHNASSYGIYVLSSYMSYVNDTGFRFYAPSFTTGWAVNWYAYE